MDPQLKKFITSTPLFLYEDLCRARARLFHSGRKAKKDRKIMDFWTSDGKIIVKDLKGVIKSVFSERDLSACFFKPLK